MAAFNALWNLCVLARGRNSYIRTSGWWRSQVERNPRDADGNPIPWITYSSIAFLEPRVRADMTVFEFGSGSSTSWWARRVKRVVSCEHDQSWFERVRGQVPPNVELMHVTRENHAYSQAIGRYEQHFDVVVIDGRDRVRCARNSIPALKPDGVIVWDNTDRAHYQAGFDFLAEQRFRRLDFVGLSPLVPFQCSTSIFYRGSNCLGI